MKVTAVPFGELQFSPYPPGDHPYLKIPHSQPFTANGAFGLFFYQLIETKHYTYWYSIYRPATDLTVHVRTEHPWLGIRLLLKNHIRYQSRLSGETYLQQGQFNLSYAPAGDSTFFLKKGEEYVVFDMSVRPGFIKGLHTNLQSVDDLLAAEASGKPTTLALASWANIRLLDVVDQICVFPMWESVAAEMLRRAIHVVVPKAGSMELSDERVESLFLVREAIRQNIRTHLHIPYLAHRAGMNEQYFKSGFRQVFGMTPFKYLEYERLKAAKKMLKESRESIQLIAEHTGFKEASSFIRVFIKAEGISPSEWRRRSRTSDFL